MSGHFKVLLVIMLTVVAGVLSALATVHYVMPELFLTDHGGDLADFLVSAPEISLAGIYMSLVIGLPVYLAVGLPAAIRSETVTVQTFCRAILLGILAGVVGITLLGALHGLEKALWLGLGIICGAALISTTNRMRPAGSPRQRD